MEPPLPLARPRVTQPTPAQVVQREVSPPEITPIGGTPSVQGQLVQRAEGEGGEPEEIDLADLARKIYPLVKRMLSIERERRSPW